MPALIVVIESHRRRAPALRSSSADHPLRNGRRTCSSCGAVSAPSCGRKQAGSVRQREACALGCSRWPIYKYNHTIRCTGAPSLNKIKVGSPAICSTDGFSNTVCKSRCWVGRAGSRPTSCLESTGYGGILLGVYLDHPETASGRVAGTTPRDEALWDIRDYFRTLVWCSSRRARAP